MRFKEGASAFGARKFCSRECAGKGSTGMTIESRFAQRIAVDESGCWIWTGATTTGYGSFKPQHDRPAVLAHRFSYELHVGPIPSDMEVDHVCHTPRCVNPDHLRLLTHADNSRYILANTRSTSGFRGVHFDKRRRAWMAHYTHDGRFRFLGYFASAEEAATAARTARVAAWGAHLEFGA